MATVLLTSAVSAAGLSGFAAFAATAAATAIGGLIDNALFGQNFEQEGPRLNEINVSQSSEGSPIKRLFGRSRLGGNIIWASNFRETKTTETQGGGKGGGGSSVTTTTYSYSISFAVAFCEGNDRVTLGRVWADGKLLDTEPLDVAFYPGSDTQPRDPTMSGIEGAAVTPAYRGTCYIVFKDLPLKDFGNRIPSITAEIIKPLEQPDPDSIEELIEGMNLIPSTGEAAYATTPTVRDDGFGNAVPENVNLSRSQSNIENSMDNLKKQLPNNSTMNLVIAWFGTDLRASACEFKPKVELKTGRALLPNAWRVNGLVRGSSAVEAVSTDVDGNPAFGGTPADFSVVEAIQRLADVDGQDVNFYPFLLMDIPVGNTLPDTETGAAGQPVYPWRGRITTSLPSVDKTAAAQTEVDSLFGSVSASDFSLSGTTVNYTGSATDFGYRRMILHYAYLCAAAANTLADPSKFKRFYIGTELRGITRIRSTASGTATASTVYPGVNALVTLLEDVRAVFDAQGLTGVELSYAGNWSEYHSHRPSDGSNDVYFNMDALWGHPDCDVVAIDNYTPLSDWRDGNTHEDFGTGVINTYNTTGTFGASGFPQATQVYDEAYLKGQIEGGEGYHYFYASDADRESQTRTKIEDTAHAQHWVFRQKDFRNWWEQSHRSRPGGVRDGSVVALSDGSGGSVDTWTPASKKIVFSEFGVPAVDKGTNQPNVFFDPKSSESFLPYFSSGNRDDYIQRVYYEAFITYWRDNAPTVGPVKMVDPSDMYAWTWDCRPYPAFPYRTDIWSDAPNYRLGHWLNGRVGVLTLGQLVREICKLGGLSETDLDITGLVNSAAIVRGYVIDQLSSPRDMLAPLSNAFLFDGFESEGKVKFSLRSNTIFTDITEDDLVVDGEDKSGYSLTRTQETELPAASTISFIDEAKDYQVGSTGGVRLVGSSRNVIDRRFPIVLTEEYARSLSEVTIQEMWSMRDRGEFRLPPSFLALDPSDGITIPLGGRTFNQRIGRIERGRDLSLTTASHDATVFETLVFTAAGNTAGDVPIFGRTILYFMDIPLINGQEPFPWATRLTAYQSPFPSSVDVYRDDGGGSLVLNRQVTVPAILGQTTTTLAGAEPWKFQDGNEVTVQLYDPSAQLFNATESEVLAGLNAAAIETSSGTWEIIQFKSANLTGATVEGLPLYNLSGLLRGQLGTETEIEASLAAGAKFVFLQPEAVSYLDVSQGQARFPFDWRYGPSGVETSSAIFQDASHTGQAVGLLPYAPVQLKKTPTPASTEVTFTWIRRTRFGGDDFEGETVPLNEENERYDLEIYDPSGPTLLRTVSDLTSPTYTYTTAQQTSDGGALDFYLIRVWQKSTSVGRGRRAEATL